MQRTKELEDYLQDYREQRTAAKRADMEKNYIKMLPALAQKNRPAGGSAGSAPGDRGAARSYIRTGTAPRS